VTRIVVMNGPNLGRLGSREPDVYGHQDEGALRALLEARAADGVAVDLRQSDDETELIRWLHAAADERTPVILNPAAFTHYSYALGDAARLVTQAGVSVIEVHISNPAARESFRHTSVVAAAVTGTIAGLGFEGYALALEHLQRTASV